MYCKNCGMICNENTRYCPRCGEPVRADRAPQAAAAKRGSRAWIPIVILLIAAVVGLLIYIFVLKNRQNATPAAQATSQEAVVEPAAPVAVPEATVEKLEDALDNLDVARAVELFDRDSRETVERYINDNLLSGLGSLGGLISNAVDFDLDVVDVSYEDEEHCTATVDGAMEIDVFGYEQSNALRIDVPLVYEDGMWYIMGTSVLDLFG